jgi:uncharacterized protein
MTLAVRRLLLPLLAVLVLVVGPMPRAGLAAEDETADVRQILEITGAEKNIIAMIDATLPQILALLRKANPNIPQDLIDQFQTDGRAEFVRSLPQFTEQMIKVVTSVYTPDEVKQLLAFYKSPLGQKMIAQTPYIAQQGRAIGQAWGQQVGARVVEQLRHTAKQKGYDL